MDIKEQFDRTVLWDVNKITGCWNTYNGAKKHEGYRTFQIKYNNKNKTITAHRFSYIVHKGDIPNGLVVMHTCDNPRCINPKHLILGTRKQNTQDMIDKGRHYTGEGLSRKKLTDQQIINIRNSTESSYQLAKIYPVSPTQIRRIKNGTRCAGIL